MKLDRNILLRALSPKIAARVMQSFDHSTTLIVSLCWSAALVMTTFAIYTVIASSSAKRAAEASLVVEPVLPKIVRSPIEARAAQTLVERLKHRYPDVTFNLPNDLTLRLSASDGSKFREWLTAVSYVDIISPEYHWTVQDFCVGKCRNDIMSATLRAEKITFSAPEPAK